MMHRHLHPKIPTVFSLGWVELAHTKPKKPTQTKNRGYFWVQMSDDALKNKYSDLRAH
jgi:hypothetical protein